MSNVELLRKLIEITVFDPDAEANYFVFPEGKILLANTEDQISEFEIPRELIPADCYTFKFGYGEEYVGRLRDVFIKRNPKNVCVFPPIASFRLLSREFREQYKRMDLHEIILKTAIEEASEGTEMGIFIPSMTLAALSKIELRNYIKEYITIRYIISCDQLSRKFPRGFLLPLSLLVFQKGKKSKKPIRFFKIPHSENNLMKLDELLIDFIKLSEQGGGETEYGYVLRESLPDNKPWTFERHNPQLKEKVEDMNHFGDVYYLKEIIDVKVGIHPPEDITVLDTEGSAGFPLIEGRDIKLDGELIYQDNRYKVNVPPGGQLVEGDILIRRFRSENRIISTVIKEDMLPLAASSNVLILRPKENFTYEDSLFLQEYLGSEVANNWLAAESSSIHISKLVLDNLPVPIPDETFKNAIKSLRKTIETYRGWIREAEEASSKVFEYDQAKDARYHILTTGQRARQREKAASLIDNFSYRIRNRYPYPIAYRWRTVESAKPGLEGYLQVLECFENTLAYLALVSLSIVSNMEDRKIGYLESIQKKLTRKGHGISLGDWLAIINEINTARDFRYLPENTPFYEVFNFLRLNPELKEKAYTLKGYRNNFAHGKGPKGKVVKNFIQARDELQDFLKGIEFISEYPLRFVEETNVDSIEGVTHYKSRDLMGDHPLVPISEFTSRNLELEAGSLYLVDREECLHLLRPWMLRRECPKCGRSTIYYLDSFDQKNGECILRGMDHKTTTRDGELEKLYKHVGLLE